LADAGASGARADAGPCADVATPSVAKACATKARRRLTAG
jgi:hypothetical protein